MVRQQLWCSIPTTVSDYMSQYSAAMARIRSLSLIQRQMRKRTLFPDLQQRRGVAVDPKEEYLFVATDTLDHQEPQNLFSVIKLVQTKKSDEAARCDLLEDRDEFDRRVAIQHAEHDQMAHLSAALEQDIDRQCGEGPRQTI